MSWQEQLENEVKLRGYSQRTIKSYTFHVAKFLASGKPPREYLLSLINRDQSDETVRAAGFAIKFYLKLRKENDSHVNAILADLPNVKREKKLPVILSKEEIERMIDATKHLNHRLMIQIGYAAGLRASEILSLQWNDIDFDRNIIHIKQSKGKKDRVVMLSSRVKDSLLSLSMDKQGFVFRTNRGGKYTPRTLQKVIENAAKKANIHKHITPHTLRHSFATHLLEQGVDIRYIKDLLGHANITTTLIYTRVSNKSLSNIKSPFD